MSVRQTRHRRRSASDLDLMGVVLDGLSAWCADRPGLTALSRVLDDDTSAAPAPRSALEQLQRKPHRAGIGGSRRWLRVGHGNERYHGPMIHDTVTVRSDCMRIELSRTPTWSPVMNDCSWGRSLTSGGTHRAPLRLSSLALHELLHETRRLLI